jgi:anti-sigma regulatory factor (Ser/Thr protein kinase)
MRQEAPMNVEPSTLTIPAEHEQATIVRQFVRLACHRYGCDEVIDNVLAVTDEFVTRALEHGSGPDATVRVGITSTRRGVRIEVHDPGHLTLSADEPAAVRQIIDGLAREWGVADEPDGTTAWAELTGTRSAAESG